MNHRKVFQRFPSSLLAACAAFAIAGSALAEVEQYEIDPAHSTIGFRVKHLFSHVTGRFDDVKGLLSIDPEKPETAKVDVIIQTKSINTAIGKRDDHLRSADFFDVEKYPTMTFTTKSVKRTGEKSAELVGDLTLHGVTKEVPLKVEFLGKGPGMQGETRAGWHVTGKLKRSDFGLTWSKAIEGVELVGDEVDLVFDVETVKK